MPILLLEDDPLVAELLILVLGNLAPWAQVKHCSTVAGAKAAWRPCMQLVICDRHLSDGSGLELVKLVRSQDRHLPIVMISAHSDRDAVMSAARLGVSEFIAKPLDIAMLQHRLTPLLTKLSPPLAKPAAKQSLSTWLTQCLSQPLKLPTALSVAAVLPLLELRDELSPQSLSRTWHNEIPLAARLLQLANGASLKRSGKPINQLSEAISTLGIEMSLSAAMALALDIRGALQEPRLIAQAQHFYTMAEQVADIARAMALSIGIHGGAIYSAGLLSRAGELAVIRALQDFINQGGQLQDAELTQALNQWSAPFGNRLKMQWGLALPMRELIGAVHQAPSYATQRALLIMHLAGLRVRSQLNTAAALRMLRQVGLDVEKWRSERLVVPALIADVIPPSTQSH
ncbi:HDOD domain-containing protein [Oceanisphaera avium]|uniref:Response regulator n=1 Tax=Oceanisphaera avium TaxID=1903694 RepID=A0A1Y0CYN9_9GAMM|nr:HDOD domain-containing protein [Oceanisphaera avium]ART80422.1 hypothetical protein CBP12_09920 [Oceanisphaera avium]